MAGSWTTDRFLQFAEAIRRLTEEHRELEDEPLHLAVSYGPMRDQQDIFLFEVIGSAEESINPDRDLFETTFRSSPGFPMTPNQKLHLILTNPRELEVALREEWPLATEIVQALRSEEDHEVLYADEVGRQAVDMIRAEARRREAVRG